MLIINRYQRRIATMGILDTKEKLCRLLGHGISQTQAASAVGVDDSYVSQLMAEPEFKERVAALRVNALSSARERDERLDALEDKMIDKLDKDLSHNPLAFKNAMERVRALHMINSMKRRSAPALEHPHDSASTHITLVLPTPIINKYINGQRDEQPKLVVNINNQIVKAGNKDLVTMQSKSMDSLVNKKEYINYLGEHL